MRKFILMLLLAGVSSNAMAEGLKVSSTKSLTKSLTRGLTRTISRSNM